ncbi:MAG: alr [Phycisphaerales bacterium]|nr:alr [Phycisphaerales bacterium]
MDAKISLGEPRVLVSRQALLHNASVVRRAVGPGVKICAMIKADAYGHGADIVADTLANFSTRRYEAPLVDALAVASIDEAERLPHTILPVYIFRPVENCFLGRQRSRIEQAIRNGWIMTLCSSSAADDVARIATSIGKRAAIQLMVDTGMTRSGVTGEELGGLLDTIEAHASLKLVGLCTHFACAEDLGNAATAEQLQLFNAATDAVAPRLKNKVIRHAANSAALFLRPETHLDMVRPGIALYGVDPSLAPSSERLLKPVMKWTAPLVQIHDVKAGAMVGYGQTWRATRDTRIGIVPVGYADGYPRCLTNRGVMVVQGQACPVAGRISMDLTTIDLVNAPHAVLGDEVIVLDSDPLSPASVYELARLASTIPYEITSGIGQRIHRVPIEIEQGVPA